MSMAFPILRPARAWSRSPIAATARSPSARWMYTPPARSPHSAASTSSSSATTARASTTTALEFAHGELPDTGNFFKWDGSYARPQFDGEGYLVTAIDTWQNGVYAAGRLVLADPLKLIAGLRYATWKSEGTYYLCRSPMPIQLRLQENHSLCGRDLGRERAVLGVRQLHRHLQAARQPRHRSAPCSIPSKVAVTRSASRANISRAG